MAYQIATEAYALNIGGMSTLFSPNQGCTKSRAIVLGCAVAGTYLDNQLVCQKDLSKASTVSYSLRNTTSDYLTNVKVQAGSCVFYGNLPSGNVLYATAVPSGNSWTIAINGSTSTTYMISPIPSSNITSYILCEKDYSYNVSIFLPSPIASNLTRVFLLSNMDSSLVGTKNYISYQDISSKQIIYTKTNSQGLIGAFIGNQCTNQSQPIIMTNGGTYSILYTEIDTSNDAYSRYFPAGIITTEWKRVHTFSFYSNIYQYIFDVRI